MPKCPLKPKKVQKKRQKCKTCKNAKSVEYQNWPMLIPHPSRTPKIAPKPQNKTIVGKEKSGWVKIHQKHTKMPFNQKDLGQIFLNQTFLNVLIKTFPKRYDTCRGLFFRPRVPSRAGWQGRLLHWESRARLSSRTSASEILSQKASPSMQGLPQLSLKSYNSLGLWDLKEVVPNHRTWISTLSYFHFFGASVNSVY